MRSSLGAIASPPTAVELQAGATASCPVGIISGSANNMKTLSGAADLTTSVAAAGLVAFKYDLGAQYFVTEYSFAHFYVTNGGKFAAVTVAVYGSTDDSSYTQLGTFKTHGFSTGGEFGDEVLSELASVGPTAVDDTYRYLKVTTANTAGGNFFVDQWKVMGY